MAKKLQEELTTEMHFEFMEQDGYTEFDMKIMGVLGAINSGMSKDAALRKYSLTQDEYDANIDRVLSI